MRINGDNIALKYEKQMRQIKIIMTPLYKVLFHKNSLFVFAGEICVK